MMNSSAEDREPFLPLPSSQTAIHIDSIDQNDARIIPPLPSPIRSNGTSLWYGGMLISTWIAISTTVIFFNNHILNEMDFPYPITLTAVHLLFQTLATRLIGRFTSLIQTSNPLHAPTPHIPHPETDSPPLPAPNSTKLMSPMMHRTDFYWTRIVPVGILFCVSLVLSNLVYLYLSLPFIQMIKAGSPIAVLTTSFIFRLKSPSVRLISIILLICSGVGIASWGEAEFNLTGFLIQVVAIMVEATRVAMIQLLLHGAGLTPMFSLYLFAPPCLISLLVLILPVEGLAPIYQLPRLGFYILLPNAALTFALNISAIYIINLSSLVLSLSKVFKDILLVVGSMVVLGHHVSLLQWVGYTVALMGLGAYK